MELPVRSLKILLIMKERVSKLTYPTLQHCLRMLYTMNGNSKHYGQAIRRKRGHKLLLIRNISAISCINAYLHIMSFITTKFHEILLSSFREVVLTRQTVVSFKKGRNSQKKNGIKISCVYAHLHIMSFITPKFQEILWSSFRGVALTNCVD